MKNPMRGRLDGVAVFVEAVEAGGFARAGERLALSRSAVGKAIARLEERLRVRLFHRTTRNQGLTEDGQTYYEYCQRAITELRTGESVLESGQREIAGRLRVTTSVLFGRHCVAPILVNLARQHPKLELELNFTDSQVDLIAEGFDLGVRSGALTQASGLRARSLVAQPKVMCAAPDYLKARGRPDNIASLAAHELLLYWRAGHPYPWLLPNAEGGMTELKFTSRLRFDDLEVIVDAAVAGMGIAWLPHWIVREQIRAGALVPLWEDRPTASTDSHAVWPAAEHLPLRVRLAIDALVAKLPEAIGVEAPRIRPTRREEAAAASVRQRAKRRGS